MEFNVSEDNILHASMVFVWWDGADGHSDAICNLAIFNQNILGAIRTPITTVTWLWDYGVVEIGNLDSSESSVSSLEINSIGVQWEGW